MIKKQKLKCNPVEQLLEKFITVHEAAEILSLATSTLNTYRTKDLGPSYVTLANRTVRYSLSEVLGYAYKSVTTTEGSTSVINNRFLSLLLDNTKLQSEVRNLLNQVDDIEHVLKGLPAANAFKNDKSKLKFGFDNLTLNFEMSSENGGRLYQKLLDKQDEGLVTSERRIRSYEFVYRVFTNRAKETGITVLFMGSDFGEDYRVQLQITPSQFNKRRSKILAKMLRYLFGTDYRELLLNAWVSRFDICIDGAGEFVDGLVFTKKGTRKRTITRSAKKNKPIYIRVGAKRSGYLAKIYYKDKEGITRIEFELFPKSKSTKLKDIFDYEMKFNRFEIYDPRFMLDSGIHPHTIYAIKELGISKALSKLRDPSERRYLKKLLKEYLICTDSEYFIKSGHKKMKPFLNTVFGLE